MALQEVYLWLPLLLLLSILFFRKQKKRQQKNFPPSPPKLPIIGNLHQIGSLPHSSMYHLSKIHGPIMSLQLGRFPAVIISSTEAAKDVLKTHDLACCGRPTFAGSGRLSYNYLDIAFSPYGDYWREIRKLCVLELLSVKRVRTYQVIREEEINSVIESIKDCATKESNIPVDLTEKLVSLMASVTYRIAFGRRFKADDFKYYKTVHHDVVDDAVTVIGGFQASECFHPFVGWIIDKLRGQHQKLERIFNEFDTCFQQLIDEHIDPARIKPDQDAIIDVLLGIEKGQKEVGVALKGKDSIKAILMNVFLGGIDNTAITMIWAMTELVRNLKIMRKAQAEVRNVMRSEGKVSEDGINQLQYLKLIVKETLRLHPPGPLLLPRQTISSFNLQGYEIPPKTLIQVNAWAIGRDPAYWKDPEEFNPERFEDSLFDFKGQNFEYLPFGSGRRGCPGIYMATSMIELVLANLLYWFDWKLPDGIKSEDLNMEESIGHRLSVSKKNPLILVPIIPGSSS